LQLLIERQVAAFIEGADFLGKGHVGIAPILIR